VQGQAWPVPGRPGSALVRSNAYAGLTGVHGELLVGWVNVNTGASGSYRVSKDFPQFAGFYDERIVPTGSGTVVVSVTGSVTILPGQGAPWAPDGIVAPVAPGVYANFIP